jgi:hypothetical protein
MRVPATVAQTWPKRLNIAWLDHVASTAQPVKESHFPPLPANTRHCPANPVEVQVLSSA